MVTNNPVCVSWWTCLNISWSNLSVKVVVHTLPKTSTQVHITDRVYTFLKFYASGKLTISVAPVVLNTFQMPLVDDYYNLLTWGFVNLFEKVFIFHINENSLHLREENIRALSIPVDKMLITALLTESGGTGHWQFLFVRIILVVPHSTVVPSSSLEVLSNIEACFVIKSLPSSVINLVTCEMKLSTSLFSSFTSKFDFNTRSHEIVVPRETEMPHVSLLV